MITKISLNNIASYKKTVILETDKKINLIYGLNGTGKSTLSNFLHKRIEDKFKDCSIEGLNDSHDIYVYNQLFIHENFFESESVKGIFTLSKKNKEAEINILKASKEIENLEKSKKSKNEELGAERLGINQKLERAKNAIWKIKTDYSGGDRVLEFCLEGYKGSKDSLFNHIVGLRKPAEKPTKSIDDLKNDLQSISGENAQKYSELLQINFFSKNVETEALFRKQIVGNENSTVSQLIREVGSSDWVKAGLKYLPIEPFKENETCPFCQEKTITKALVESIKNYFDASYKADIDSLESFFQVYLQAIQLIPNKTIFESNPKFESNKKDFELKYNAFVKVVEDNKRLIENKINTPSIQITLNNSAKALQELNEIIQKINMLIAEHNKNIDQKALVRSNIKAIF
jgi:wobble nucleotide-excising tRNase